MLDETRFSNQARDRLPLAGLDQCLTLKVEDGWELVLSGSSVIRAMLEHWPPEYCRSEELVTVSMWMYRSPVPGWSVQDLLCLAWSHATLALSARYPEVESAGSPMSDGYAEDAPRRLAEVLQMSPAEREAAEVLYRLDRG